MPERHFAEFTGRWSDHHPLKSDVNDAPSRSTKQEELTDTAFVDHLFVEFTHPGAVGQEHAEQPPVGDGASVGDRKTLRSCSAAQRAFGAIPHHPGTQL